MKRPLSKSKPQLISIVIPVYNEAENLPALYQELTTVLQSLPYRFETIFVDDGSTDATLNILSQLAKLDKRIKALSFSRNFGHQAALSAGLQFAEGDAVITMDGDLQHPPSLIPMLIEKWSKGNEIVHTIREETKHEPFLKKVSSKIFYRLLNTISDTPIHPQAADFRLLDRRVVESLKSITERDRFLRGLISWVGYTSTSVPYKADARHAGASKYRLSKMLKLALDGVVSFSAAPLHVVFYLGLLVSGSSFLYGIFSLYAHFFTDTTVPGWTSILVAVLFLGGVQLISIGIVGEYLIRVYNESKGRPLYLIKNALGIDVHGATRR